MEYFFCKQPSRCTAFSEDSADSFSDCEVVFCSSRIRRAARSVPGQVDSGKYQRTLQSNRCNIQTRTRNYGTLAESIKPAAFEVTFPDIGINQSLFNLTNNYQQS